MSTTTATFGHTSAATAKAAKPVAPRKGLFERFMEARMRTGRSHAAAVLGRMSDDQLAGLGFTAAQIREVRATGQVPMSFWA